MKSTPSKQVVDLFNLLPDENNTLSDATHYTCSAAPDNPTISDVWGEVAKVDRPLFSKNLPERFAAAMNAARYIPTRLLEEALIVDLLELVSCLSEFVDEDDLEAIMRPNVLALWRAAVGKEGTDGKDV
jgi:hypothetical protein